MINTVQIYVYLPDEAVDTWRPVQAVNLHGNVYQIVTQFYDIEDEKWEFEPGDIVRCEYVKLSSGSCLTAIEKYT